ncbi:hypothetical protein H5410_001730 [Solanum commersonii]|uniref:Uncharacterized protein n=1 Tax=Solanum commersonii TaxID=4109 RepID=A0A9J6AZL3_SOLCO|nr:hypothetical protein H5410_001730 [Solanum commersonii]
MPYLHEPEVREFYYKMELLDDGGIPTIVREVDITLSEESLGIILGVPSQGIRSVEGCKPSSEYAQRATKYGDLKFARLPKKASKGTGTGTGRWDEGGLDGTGDGTGGIWPGPGLGGPRLEGQK